MNFCVSLNVEDVLFYSDDHSGEPSTRNQVLQTLRI